MQVFNRFERARIIGARALQVGMGAPIIVVTADLLDPVKIAEAEFRQGLIPITVTQRRKAGRPVEASALGLS